jgi:uncharacterized protein YggU (UPF0235/DUF167 family)
MTRITFILISILISTNSKSQNITFAKQTDELFFNINVSDFSNSIIDSLRKVSKLNYVYSGVKQINLNVTMEMNSGNARSSRHFFYFKESPLANFKIKKGEIEIKLGESDSLKKILGIDYKLEFNDSVSARVFFENIKFLFKKVSTISNFEILDEVGEIAEFLSIQKDEKVIRAASFILGKVKSTNKFEITLKLEKELMD